MAKYMKANGKMIKLMDMVAINTLMALFMRVNERMICSMDMVLKNGLMVLIMMEIINKVLNMDLEDFIDQMAQFMKVNLYKII